MENYLNCKKIDTAISRARKILIKKAKENGIYENFGQEEIREIRDKFIKYGDYSRENWDKINKLSDFTRWCMDYTI